MAVTERVGAVWATPYNSAQDVEDMMRFQQRTLIAIAREEKGYAERDGLDKQSVIRTDNRWYKPLSNILPFGKVEWSKRVIPAEALIKIYSDILKHSPRGATRLYVRHNYVYIGAKLVAKSLVGLELYLRENEIAPDVPIWFINTMPYARKLERYAVTSSSRPRKIRRARTRKTGGWVKRPNGAYAIAARSAKSFFGQWGYVDFRLHVPGLDGITLPMAPNGMRSTYATGKTVGKPYPHPGIRIMPFASGQTNGNIDLLKD